ncbi:MAG: aminotransferase class I/II-fold pyridoxal phosphate-dependent enzyme [Treponema sp.]|nr:aminotransferase class I/II-fold pyridoxal phosphate-dependent enzyme [Treponema sp.]
MIHPLAQELNDTLEGTAAKKLLSELGTRMYFPKGIISQSAEAKQHATHANGTIGMAMIAGMPAILPSITKNLPAFNPRELVAYAPTAGLPELRHSWKQKILEKNSRLNGTPFSLPIVVPGLTAGLSYIADVFTDRTKPVLTAYPSWDNYALIVSTRHDAALHQFELFADGHLNIPAFETAVQQEARAVGSVRILLNFPHNPSGYSPTHEEVCALVRIITDTAESGIPVLVISDDAYFGLTYEQTIEAQSLFAYIANCHTNVLAVKIDGPTKEDFSWGLRTGFITFAAQGMNDAQYEALTKKFMGIIRSSVSCSATPSQSILLHAFMDPAHEEQKNFFRALLEKRYRAVRTFIDSHHSSVLEALPFNSGYFMSFRTRGIDAEKLRTALLMEHGIGTVSIDEQTLRVAFSSIDDEKIEAVYTAIYETAETLSQN